MSDALVNGLAGAAGGIVAQLLTYPLQTVNTRQQTERKLREQRADGSTKQKLPPANNVAGGAQSTRGLVQGLLQIIATEGWGGLYSGLQPSLIGTAASQIRRMHSALPLLARCRVPESKDPAGVGGLGVYYYFYQLFQDKAQALALRRKQAGKGDGTLGTASNLLVASLAGVVNVLLTNPIWIIVTRMQTQSQVKQLRAGLSATQLAADESSSSKLSEHEEHQSEDVLASVEAAGFASAAGQELHRPPRRHQGMVATITELYSEAGVLGFWKGVFPGLVMVSNPALQFAIYEGLMAKITADRPQTRGGVKAASALEIFASGAIAKLGATVCTYPLLVVKSRLQARQEIGSDANSRYTGTADAVLKMLRHEGLAGFYKGMSTKIMQSVFAAAVLFLTKEELVKLVRALVEKQKALRSALPVRAAA